MLHESMNIYRLMVHANKVEEAMARRNNRDSKRKDLLMEVLHRINLTDKTSLDLTTVFQIKFLPNSLRLVGIGCLTLSLKREKELTHQFKRQLVECVAKSTMVKALGDG